MKPLLAAILLLAILATISRRRQPEAWGRWVEPDDGFGLFV